MIETLKRLLPSCYLKATPMPMTLDELARWLNKRVRRYEFLADNYENDATMRAVFEEDARYFAAAIQVVDWASDHGMIEIKGEKS